MKKTLSIIMALVIAMSAFTVMSFAADSNESIIKDKILLETGSTKDDASLFAIGERVYGKLEGDQTAIYKFYVDKEKEVTFRAEASNTLKFTVERYGSIEKYNFDSTNDKTITLSNAFYFVKVELVDPFITTDTDSGSLRATVAAKSEYCFSVLTEDMDAEVYGALNKTEAELIAGDSLQLKVELHKDCNIENLNCFWRIIDDPKAEVKASDVATVTDDGLVTISMNKGTFTKETEITVQAVMYYGSDVETTADCKIKATPANIYLEPYYDTTDDYKLVLAVGGTRDISAKTNVKEMDIVWTTNNPEIVTVSEDGKITAVAAGEATVKATIGTSPVYRSIKVVVDPNYVAVAGVTFNEHSATVRANESINLGYSFTTAPADAAEPSNKKVTFTSSDTAIATVDADGKVTGVAEGTVKITVTSDDGSFTDECEVKVTPGIPNWLMVVIAPVRIIINLIILLINNLTA